MLIIVQYKGVEKYSLFSVTCKTEERWTWLLERLKAIERHARNHKKPSITHRERDNIVAF